MVNRVPSQQVVDAAPIVIDENDPDLIFLNAKKVITVKDGKTVYDKYVGDSPGIGGDTSGSSSAGSSANVVAEPAAVVVVDTPSLSDIESITYEQYYDSSKKARIKAIIKVRNSSLKAQEVVGVDARVYSPS